jgi:hypothetical protein
MTTAGFDATITLHDHHVALSGLPKPVVRLPSGKR